MRHYLPLMILTIVVVTTCVTVYMLRDRFEILGEFIAFLRERKMMWIAPLVIVFILTSILVLVVGQSFMAAIYPLF